MYQGFVEIDEVWSNLNSLNLLSIRHGANPVPFDGGISPVLAILDKLMEYEDKVYPYQLCACLNLLLLAIPFIELPYKVNLFCVFLELTLNLECLELQPLVFEVRKEMFIKKYSVLIGNQHLIKPNQVFGVSQLKHLCRWVLMTINFNLFLSWL